MAPLIIVTHDRAASQATFVEITFELNVAFATYEKFRKYIGDRLDKRLAVCFAASLAAEANQKEHQERISKLKQEIAKHGSDHTLAQEEMCRIVRALSFFMCVLCLIVLYFDFLESWGHYLIILIAPLPIYVVLSYVYYGLCLLRANLIKRQYVQFIDKFEKPPSVEIQEGLDSMGNGEDDK
jgi:hypothetical protein